jgi:D-cysteine desulfhydrase
MQVSHVFRRPDNAAQLQPLHLGNYPTPVERIGALSNERATLWVKRDDRTHEVYGGSKVRKLEWLLADAHARGATRIVTMGAVGSHHVLATTYFGRREGFEVEAILVPQPRTPHVVATIRASLALGLRPVVVRSRVAAWLVTLARSVHRARYIPVGGSSVLGAMGYVAAARELAAQVRRGEMPEPDVCVVALGSGGTAAGLAAGFADARMKTRVVGVCVAEPIWAVGALAGGLARGCARRLARTRPAEASPGGAAPTHTGLAAPVEGAAARLEVDPRFLGAGYGHRTAEGDEAARVAEAAAGLELDGTYTAKAFASALWHVRARQGRVILYWHTLSSAPLGPLLAGAPSESDLAPRLRELAR